MGVWNLAELRFRVLRVYGRVYGFEVWVWRLGFRRLGCRVGDLRMAANAMASNGCDPWYREVSRDNKPLIRKLGAFMNRGSEQYPNNSAFLRLVVDYGHNDTTVQGMGRILRRSVSRRSARCSQSLYSKGPSTQTVSKLKPYLNWMVIRKIQGLQQVVAPFGLSGVRLSRLEPFPAAFAGSFLQGLM